jgi:hypothetical protein
MVIEQGLELIDIIDFLHPGSHHIKPESVVACQGKVSQHFSFFFQKYIFFVRWLCLR